MSDNKTSSLHKHLMGGDISALETALKLEATVGFPYSDYEYYSYDWDSEEDYYNFIYFGEKSSSISGHIYNKFQETSYDITIILYNGKYFTQVEKSWEWDCSDNIIYYTDSFEDYLSALKFAYKEVFN
jgi:hypothetical protein